MSEADGDRPDPASVVADADVLAADLLVGGPAREALDCVRSHSWVTLVASDALLDDAEAVIADRTDDPGLAAEWRERIETLRTRVEQTAGDHPALASAYEGNAAHVLTMDDDLTGARTNLSLRSHLPVSVRTPAAFVHLFDPEALYPTVVGGRYPGPDRNPRG